MNRLDVKQVSKLWVQENCKNITQRDIGLLELLSKRRLLRRDQIYRLYPKFASVDVLNKRLKMLYNKHVIDRIRPPVRQGEGSSQQYVCLDRAGIILLGLDKYNKPIYINNIGNKSLFLGWEHRVLINEYECIIKEVITRLGGRLLIYLSESPVMFNNTKLIPDIFILMSRNNKGYLMYIEIDQGTEDIPYVKNKLNSYMDYYISKRWLQEPWARVLSPPSFPGIYFFTQDNRSKRIATLQNYTSEKSVKFKFYFHSQLPLIIEDILKS